MRTYTVIKHFLSHVFIFSRILASHVDYDCVYLSLLLYTQQFVIDSMPLQSIAFGLITLVSSRKLGD